MSRPAGYLVPGTLDPDAVVAEVARGFRVSIDDLMSDKQTSHIATARNCAMAVIRLHTKWSWATIAAYFGRTHATVSRNVGLILADSELSLAVDLVVQELRSVQERSIPVAVCTKPRGCSPGNQQGRCRTMGK